MELTTSRSSGTRRTETHAHACRNQAARRAPNWKFCEFKHSRPSVIFGAPESAIGARPRRERLTGIESLTPGELGVARLAVQGLTNRQIAQALFVSTKTVGTIWATSTTSWRSTTGTASPGSCRKRAPYRSDRKHQAGCLMHRFPSRPAWPAGGAGRCTSHFTRRPGWGGVAPLLVAAWRACGHLAAAQHRPGAWSALGIMARSATGAS